MQPPVVHPQLNLILQITYLFCVHIGHPHTDTQR
jgi:hypothetical protein